MGRGGGGFGVGQRRQRRLVRTGISLVVLGHLTLVLGAIVHGSVLRHVARPGRAITSEYAVSNIIAVLSGLLSVATGVAAILLSRSRSHRAQPWVLLVAALANSLVSGACCVGLILAVSLTMANSGRLLLLGCNSSALPSDARRVMTNECPFDTTRIYDTALFLWLPSLVMAAVEAGLSAWCCMVSLSRIRTPEVLCREALLQDAGQEAEAAAEGALPHTLDTEAGLLLEGKKVTHLPGLAAFRPGVGLEGLVDS